MNKIKKMFSLQEQLNESTNGTDWITGKTSEGNDISWYRCIYMEAAEAIDSFPWKHWKDLNAEPDWINLRVELVDIWHFVMSQIIFEEKVDMIDNFILIEPVETPNKDELILIIEDILIQSSGSSKSGDSSIEGVSALLFKAFSLSGMSIDDLYVAYVVKNQLNTFRQNNGYKDGSYIKIWDAVEDNVIALHIMEEDSNMSPSQFYKKLEIEYHNLPEFSSSDGQHHEGVEVSNSN